MVGAPGVLVLVSGGLPSLDGPEDLWGVARWPSNSVIFGARRVAGGEANPATSVWTTTEVPVHTGWDFTLSGFAVTEK